MSEFLKRTISGLLFVIVLVGAIYIGHITFFILFLAITTATMLEFYHLGLKAKLRPQSLLGVFIGMAFFIWSYFYSSGRIEQLTLYGFVPLLVSIFVVELYRHQQKPMQNIALTLLGIFYIALPFSLMNFITINGSSYSMDYNPNILLGILFLVWANDTGAYVVGVSMGKHKMIPRISPKKSWEGFVGGIATTLLVAWVIAMFFDEVSLKHWLAIGLITALMAVLGDLVESMFKRSIGVKDSGKFLPGHGGLLDRFDALLMVLPMVYVYLEVMMII
ncbi:phosphatidate cytidylyltransferase [Tenuifilum osseticum]|uniref:phosphatidate cytidylyltransferase n=1 Tax=Tenuifilum osseticum TaxID=3374723 RepID=UPI0034E609B6